MANAVIEGNGGTVEKFNSDEVNLNEEISKDEEKKPARPRRNNRQPKENKGE